MNLEYHNISKSQYLNIAILLFYNKIRKMDTKKIFKTNKKKMS